MKWAVWLPLLLLAPGSAPPAEKIIGLLSLPEVFGQSGACDAGAKARPVIVYSAPASTRAIGEIRVDHPPSAEAGCGVNVHLRTGEVIELPAEEYGYEERGAVVVDQRGRWFKLHLGRAAGWVQASADDHFYSLEELLDSNHTELAYLTEAWDGRIARSPGGTLVPLPEDPRRRFIGYLTPVDKDVEVVVPPGQDPEEVRKRYRSTGMWGPQKNPDGTMTVVIHTSTSVDAFERPDAAAPAAFRFWNDDVGVLRGIHGTSAFVFDRRFGWFQVARRNEREDAWRTEQRLWVSESPAWEFHAVADGAERQRLAEDGWGPEYHDLRILGFDRIRGELWAHVELLDHSFCEGPEDPKPVGEGWVPIHTDAGERTIWFPSRGC